MGTTGYWLAAKADPADLAGAPELAGLDLTFAPLVDGWVDAVIVGMPHPLQPDDLLEAFARRLGLAAAVAFVMDSDLGVFGGIDPSGTTHSVGVNKAAFDSYGIPDQGIFDAAHLERLFLWSAHAPAPLDPARLAEIVGQQWTFADEGLAAIGEAVGLPVRF